MDLSQHFVSHLLLNGIILLLHLRHILEWWRHWQVVPFKAALALVSIRQLRQVITLLLLLLLSELTGWIGISLRNFLIRLRRFLSLILLCYSLRWKCRLSCELSLLLNELLWFNLPTHNRQLSCDVLDVGSVARDRCCNLLMCWNTAFCHIRLLVSCWGFERPWRFKGHLLFDDWSLRQATAFHWLINSFSALVAGDDSWRFFGTLANTRVLFGTLTHARVLLDGVARDSLLWAEWGLALLAPRLLS